MYHGITDNCPCNIRSPLPTHFVFRNLYWDNPFLLMSGFARMPCEFEEEPKPLASCHKNAIPIMGSDVLMILWTMFFYHVLCATQLSKKTQYLFFSILYGLKHEWRIPHTKDTESFDHVQIVVPRLTKSQNLQQKKICTMSHVICQLTPVNCHLSSFTCHLSP